MGGDGIKGNLMQLIWEDSFCCGNQLIDSQHQALFHLSNELLEAVFSARPAPEIGTITTRLLADISQHFHDEESILEAAGFPGLSQHVAEHARLLTKGRELAEEFAASTLMGGDLFQFLASEVILHHMLEADRDYFPFINKAGAADSDAVKDA
jgi:hemerythrin-like metal-binding protein